MSVLTVARAVNFYALHKISLQRSAIAVAAVLVSWRLASPAKEHKKTKKPSQIVGNVDAVFAKQLLALLRVRDC